MKIEKMNNLPTNKDLLAVGGHFGHSKSRLHPSAKNYVFTIRDGVAIIDLDKTTQLLKKAIDFLIKARQEKKVILFVASKNRVAEKVSDLAQKLDEPYCCYRWIGGGLTNFQETIRKNQQRLQQLRQQLADKEGLATKRECLLAEKELAKLEQIYGGMERLSRLPDIIFVVDPVIEKTVMREARRLDLTIVAIADTNADLRQIDYPIVVNDDSLKAVELVLEAIKNNLKSKNAK